MVILSGFMPIPLAMMIPFMGAQSLVLGKQFGEGFQYGKRKISAMSNEEFNAITPAKLAQNNADELREMIPSMQQSITDMRGFQSFIVKELIETIKQLPSDVFQGVTGTDSVGEAGANVRRNIEGQLGLREALGISKEGFIADMGKIMDKGITLNIGGLGNFLPQAFAEQPKEQRRKDDEGKIGPEEPRDLLTKEEVLLNQKYKDMPFAQLESELNAGIRGNMSMLEKRVILFWINQKRPRGKEKLTLQQFIDEINKFTPEGFVRQAATLMAKMKTWLASLKFHRGQSDRNPQKQININKDIKMFLDIAKEYNRLVALNRKPQLQVDTAKSMREMRIIAK